MLRLLAFLAALAATLPAQIVEFRFDPDFSKKGIVLIPYNPAPAFAKDAAQAFRSQYPRASEADIAASAPLLPYSFLLINNSGQTLRTAAAGWTYTSALGHPDGFGDAFGPLTAPNGSPYWIRSGEEHLILPVFRSGDLSSVGSAGWPLSVQQAIDRFEGSPKIRVTLDLVILEDGLLVGPDSANYISGQRAFHAAGKEFGAEVDRIWRTTFKPEAVKDYFKAVAKDAPSMNLMTKASKLPPQEAFELLKRIEMGRLATQWGTNSQGLPWDKLMQTAERYSLAVIPVFHR